MSTPGIQSTPGTVTACFYRGRTLADLLVRAGTRRPGQPFADVPSHCAVVVRLPLNKATQVVARLSMPSLFEYVSTGWQWRTPTAEDYAWAYSVPVPDIAGAITAAEAGKGRYDWGEIALFVLARLVPDRWIPRLEKATGWTLPNHICSLFLRSVLMGGGWASPAWLAGSDCPPSPNDMLLSVRETLALKQ